MFQCYICCLQDTVVVVNILNTTGEQLSPLVNITFEIFKF